MIKHCVICGSEFESNYHHQITCGRDCRDAYNRPKSKLRKVCKQCGNEFTSDNTRASFCSIKCKKEYNNEQASGKYIPREKGNRESQNTRGRKAERAREISIEIINNEMQVVARREGKILSHWPLTFCATLKGFIKKRDGNECSICGKKSSLAVHHIIPRAKGGTNNPENLITLCDSCHRIIESNTEKSAAIKCRNRARKMAI